MHIFVTGGSGKTGPAILTELIGAGHTITGLARSEEAEARLRALGARTLRGSLENLESLEEGARTADGVIHRRDAAVLFRLAVEKAPPGSVLHGAGESAITFETIARCIGRQLQIAPASLTPDEAVSHFGHTFLARAFGVDAPVSSASTRKLLGWRPTHATLLEDLETGDYFSPQSASKFQPSPQRAPDRLP